MKPNLYSPFLKIIVLLVLDYATVPALGIDTISLNQTVIDGETLVSAGKAFEFGFFGPSRSNKERFVGVWIIKHPGAKIGWVANREQPLTDGSGAIKIGLDGNLIITDGKNIILWSTNVTLANNNTIVVLHDTGNLVLSENKPNGTVFWESFNNPADSLFPGMKIGLDQRTGNRLSLRSWKNEQDPRIGSFIALLDPQESPQIIVMNGSTKHWRTGQWTGTTFVGVASMANDYRTGFSLSVDSRANTLDFVFAPLIDSLFSQSIYLSPTGDVLLWDWDNSTSQWASATISVLGPCDLYGTCGPFGNCSNEGAPICKCLRGYVPKVSEEWSKGIWSSGCVRRTEFECERNTSSDGLLMFPGMKLPDFSNFVISFTVDDCKSICLRNCSCIACAYVAGLGCLLWGDDLIDIQKFPAGGEELHIRLAFSELDSNTTSSIKDAGGKKPSKFLAILVVPVVIILGFIVYILYKRKNKKREISLLDDIAGGENSEVPYFTLQSIEIATDKFSSTNILGQGGFGPVYKGKLPNGQEIAVKRLSKSSGQGNEEFKNEVILFSKLQHRNLVKLLGLCIQEEEKMLVYEYMPNKSLDSFIFGSSSTKKEQLDWNLRYNIIEGIARGLLYLHRDSRLKIIHRDLKASNVLLDEHMNPKISDFGLARIFGGDQSVANTNRVVGTYGYMPPEYAMQGIFSEKSDVFSYGVLLLEIISGIKNNGYHHNENSQTLLAYAWQLWKEEKALELLDSNVADSYNPTQVNRCIHLALLCVQEHVDDRPTMSIVVSMLSNDTNLAFPERPAFSSNARPDHTNSSSIKSSTISENMITLTTVEGR